MWNSDGRTASSRSPHLVRTPCARTVGKRSTKARMENGWREGRESAASTAGPTFSSRGPRTTAAAPHAHSDPPPARVLLPHMRAHARPGRPAQRPVSSAKARAASAGRRGRMAPVSRPAHAHAHTPQFTPPYTPTGTVRPPTSATRGRRHAPARRPRPPRPGIAGRRAAAGVRVSDRLGRGRVAQRVSLWGSVK